jgi:hypothetical protein
MLSEILHGAGIGENEITRPRRNHLGACLALTPCKSAERG